MLRNNRKVNIDFWFHMEHEQQSCVNVLCILDPPSCPMNVNFVACYHLY